MPRKSEDVFTELNDIKKLLILKLLTDGVTQGQIAAILGIDQGNFSRMFPVKKLMKKK